MNYDIGSMFPTDLTDRNFGDRVKRQVVKSHFTKNVITILELVFRLAMRSSILCYFLFVACGDF